MGMRRTPPSRRIARGQGLVEYAVLLGVIMAVAVIGLMLMGSSVSTVFQKTSAGIAPTPAFVMPTFRK